MFIGGVLSPTTHFVQKHIVRSESRDIRLCACLPLFWKRVNNKRSIAHSMATSAGATYRKRPRAVGVSRTHHALDDVRRCVLSTLQDTGRQLSRLEHLVEEKMDSTSILLDSDLLEVAAGSEGPSPADADSLTPEGRQLCELARAMAEELRYWQLRHARSEKSLSLWKRRARAVLLPHAVTT